MVHIDYRAQHCVRRDSADLEHRGGHAFAGVPYFLGRREYVAPAELLQFRGRDILIMITGLTHIVEAEPENCARFKGDKRVGIGACLEGSYTLSNGLVFNVTEAWVKHTYKQAGTYP